MLKKLALIIVVIMLLVPLASTSAQDNGDPETVQVYHCQAGGCETAETPWTKDDASLVLGSPPPEDYDDPAILCGPPGCSWTWMNQKELEADNPFADQMEFTEEEADALLEEYCGGECHWIDLTTEDLQRLFPELFPDVPAEPIQPVSGQWHFEAEEIAAVGDCAQAQAAMENAAQPRTDTLEFSEPFQVTDVMDTGAVPATTANPMPNVYRVTISEEGWRTDYLYRIVSEDFILASMRFELSVPDIFTCTAWLKATIERVDEAE